ncbi:MAG TPA: YggS family pyridoxal phosphate-dependent enzyme [Candidatus Lambdaproteobacteria bacterium]|nr:YggS family pyridoxal phosphate-dependent enzyme [Deltaproteobacteria bacterium]HHZ77894.1 YggS family pyridoxal phosphate-dependent enzyme [Candidatus Lambdaproteobacteria bacterium]HIB44768.1 YggS family pyridoxal phosphate-dependent enzyme [Candidatus Lambdaproteobacteria bacterium]HIO11849.1 YggS family pyridoxal phosphate-dependent enzyme [Deltaproteobacteria bacterium]HIO61621.1 YggS family pyridoxal phosphate-dependent enzyme [Deltaproteobacteria bacterium]
MSVKDRLAVVQQQINQAAIQSGRTPEDIKLIAVSKTKSVEQIREALAAKQIAFGENRIQEALGKIEALSSNQQVEWHFIGHLQKNKVKFCPENFQWIHTVESIELTGKLEARFALAKKKINVLIQVNLSREESKSGLQEWEGILRVAETISSGHWLKFRGLMTIPAPDLGEIKTRKIYEQMRKWRDKLQYELNAPEITELSMGMTADFNWAIQEGATMIRIGTAIFGARN